MSDIRPAQKCEHPAPKEICEWPYCTCLREGQERQGMRYEDFDEREPQPREESK